MPETRAQLFVRLLAMVGSERFTSVSPGDGWPGRANLKLDGGIVPLAIFVGPVGKSHRGRDDIERRFQNPVQSGLPAGTPAGKPIVVAASGQPLLLGVSDEWKRPVVIAADPLRRAGHTTRYSVFAPLDMLPRAAVEGWQERVNSDGELLTAFWPELLPVFVESQTAGVRLRTEEVNNLLEAAGAHEDPSEESLQRTRRAALQLVRRKAFSSEVCEAYNQQCALCGFNFSLVVGAHVLPANAPGSRDQVWNGVALCNNHHAAFDAHLIHVAADTRRVQLHPTLLASASKNQACQSFVDVTFGSLREPRHSKLRPRTDMFLQRYEFFPTKYDWAE